MPQQEYEDEELWELVPAFLEDGTISKELLSELKRLKIPIRMITQDKDGNEWLSVERRIFY
jgi:hypothetical protein